MTEIDAVGAQEAFEVALALAEAVGDERSMAAASRELGVVAMAQVRVAFIEMYASGEIPKNVLLYEPLAVPYMAALGRFQRAIEVYDRLADRRGLMSAILGLAYATWGADFAFSGAIRRLEELRRLTARLATLTIESERTLAELQLLYGMHVYGREFGGPDLALSRGEEAYRKARVAGEPMIEQLAAGGVAMAYLQVGGLDEAALWLDRAAEAAAASPTPLKARRMEMWRGRHAAATGDAARMREHLGRAVEMARSQGLAAACCEALALLAIEAARLGADRADAELLQVAEAAALEAAGLATSLPGRPPWHARAMAALTHVQSARGEAEAALQSARAVLAELDASEQEELFVDIRLPCLRAILAAGDADEASMVAARHRLLLGGAAEHTLDDDVRGRWFATMPQSELCALVGGMDAARDAFRESPLVVLHGSLPTASIDLNVEEQRLLELMTEARTDSEMAATLGISEDQLARQLAGVLARLNAPSRGAATAFALLQRLV
jgi:DNA-binding CsgD family transcriptional regulator/tetratricopeptide (TPR) repeat protein